MPESTPSRATVALAAEADALDTLSRTLDARADVVRASIEELSGDDDHPAHAVARAHLDGIVVGYTMAAAMAAVEARRRAVVTLAPDHPADDFDQLAMRAALLAVEHPSR